MQNDESAVFLSEEKPESALRSPEYWLCVEIMRLSIMDYLLWKLTMNPAKRERELEPPIVVHGRGAARWIFSDNPILNEFSFRGVCNLLGWDAARVQQQLVNDPAGVMRRMNSHYCRPLPLALTEKIEGLATTGSCAAWMMMSKPDMNAQPSTSGRNMPSAT